MKKLWGSRVFCLGAGERLDLPGKKLELKPEYPGLSACMADCIVNAPYLDSGARDESELRGGYGPVTDTFALSSVASLLIKVKAGHDGIRSMSRPY
jgi:hypothetical protein